MAMFIWLMLIPLALSIGTFFVCRLFGPSYRHEFDNTWNGIWVALAALSISALVLTGAFYMGRGIKTHDTQTINGQVTGKERVHGSYVESYSCHCHSVCSGSGKNRSCSTECDTCYRDHYTVKWYADSTVGNFTIDAEDWTSSSVYSLPNPPRYDVVMPGEPASKTVSYINYVKAVPDSLFHTAPTSTKEKFFKLIPGYPGHVYDFYRLDRVISVGVNIPNLEQWNYKLGVALETLGPQKQANAIILFVNTPDPDYFYALQSAWMNGKKNDIVVVIGTNNLEQKPEWVKVMAWSKEDIFKVTLQDDILDMDNLTPDKVIDTLAKDVTAYFKRERMHHYQYLESEIDPPAWIVALAVILVFIMYGLFNGYVVIKQDFPWNR